MPANGAVLADLADREERPAVRRHRSRLAGRRWVTWSDRQRQTGGTSKLRTGRATWEGHPVNRSFVVSVTGFRRIVAPPRPARFHDPQDFGSALAPSTISTFPHAAPAAHAVRHRACLKAGECSRETVYVITDLTSRLAHNSSRRSFARSGPSRTGSTAFRDTTVADDASTVLPGDPEQAARRSFAIGHPCDAWRAGAVPMVCSWSPADARSGPDALSPSPQAVRSDQGRGRRAPCPEQRAIPAS